MSDALRRLCPIKKHQTLIVFHWADPGWFCWMETGGVCCVVCVRVQKSYRYTGTAGWTRWCFPGRNRRRRADLLSCWCRSQHRSPPPCPSPQTASPWDTEKGFQSPAAGPDRTRPPTLWDKVWTVRVWCVKLIFSMGRRHVFDWYRELPRPHTHFLSISSLLTLVQRSITSNIWTRWHDVRKYQENTSYPIKPPEFRKPESWTVGERAQRQRERETHCLSLSVKRLPPPPPLSFLSFLSLLLTDWTIWVRTLKPAQTPNTTSNQ